MKNPYSVLGVARSASDHKLKQIYRELVFHHHPDRNAGCELAAARFREVKAAYEVLKTPDARADTNAKLDAKTARRTPSPASTGTWKDFPPLEMVLVPIGVTVTAGILAILFEASKARARPMPIASSALVRRSTKKGSRKKPKKILVTPGTKKSSGKKSKRAPATTFA